MLAHILLGLLAVQFCVYLASGSAVTLDAETFITLYGEQDRDLLVLFHDGTVPDIVELFDEASDKMEISASSSIVMGDYDYVARGGFPAGLVFHLHGSFAFVFFPVRSLDKDPSVYDWEHDTLSIFENIPSSEKEEFNVNGAGRFEKHDMKAGSPSRDSSTCATATVQDSESDHSEHSGSCTTSHEDHQTYAFGSHNHSHDHDYSHHHGGEHENNHHGHTHASRPSVQGLIRWLRSVTTFPAEIPQLSAGDLWAGREDKLISAVAHGMDAIIARLNQLLQENNKLKQQVEYLRMEKKKCSC